MRRSGVKLIWTKLTVSELAQCTGSSGRVLVVGVLSVDGVYQEWSRFMEVYEETMSKSAEEMKKRGLFMEAAKYGIESVFEGIDGVNEEVLLTAVRFGHLSVVSRLLILDCSFIEALKITAVQNGNLEMLKLLHNYNAQVSEELLVASVRGGNPDIVKLLFDNCKSFNPEKLLLTAVCNNKNAECLKFLIKKLEPSLQTSVNEKTLLVHAMEHDAIECAKVLIKECPRLVQDPLFRSLSEKNQNIHNYARKVLISLGES